MPPAQAMRRYVFQTLRRPIWDHVGFKSRRRWRTEMGLGAIALGKKVFHLEAASLEFPKPTTISLLGFLYKAQEHKPRGQVVPRARMVEVPRTNKQRDFSHKECYPSPKLGTRCSFPERPRLSIP